MTILGRSSVRALLAPVALALFSLPSTAQVRHAGLPAVSRLAERSLSVVDVMPPDVSALIAEDEANEASRVPGPLRFGVPLSVPFVFEDLAHWEVTEDGELLVARLEVRAPGAYSLGLEAAEFELPADGKLFFYDPDMSMVLGAYTRSERIHTGEFVVEPLVGDRMIIEYQQPAQSRELPHIAVRTMIYDYRDVFELERQLETHSDDGYSGGACTLVDVNCPEGDPYPLHKRAAVRTVYGGGLCSGVLINNAQNDETKYLYTANHCGTGSTVVVRFNYQRSGCGAGTAPTGQNTSGAVLLANDQDTDGRFMRITGNIPDSYNPYYAGWSRATANLSFGMSMTHPSGGPKKIAIDTNGGGQSTSGFIGIGSVKVWSMNFQIGGTLGGSSGGPLFDQNGYIRGTLTGGPDSSCEISLYGRFHNFWNDVGLGTWLDPLGTGAFNLEGFDPFADLTPPSLSGVSPSSGPQGGFTVVTLTGSGLDGAHTVTFDGVPATSVTEVNDSTVLATSPAGSSLGLVDVVLTDGFGSSTLSNAFNYTPSPAPDVALATPDQGDIVGGDVITITGATVVGVTEVQFDGVPGTGLQIVDASTLKVTTPAAASSGLVDVTVIGNGSDILVDGFGYVSQGSVFDVGEGLAGTNGLVPLLGVSGDLVPGGSGFTVTALLVKTNTIGALFASVGLGAVPFKGGTLYTVPIDVNLPIATGPIALYSLPVSLDASVPGGLTFHLQMALADAGAVHGVSLSNCKGVSLGSN